MIKSTSNKLTQEIKSTGLNKTKTNSKILKGQKTIKVSLKLKDTKAVTNRINTPISRKPLTPHGNKKIELPSSNYKDKSPKKGSLKNNHNIISDETYKVCATLPNRRETAPALTKNINYNVKKLERHISYGSINDKNAQKIVKEKTLSKPNLRASSSNKREEHFNMVIKEIEESKLSQKSNKEALNTVNCNKLKENKKSLKNFTRPKTTTKNPNTTKIQEDLNQANKTINKFYNTVKSVATRPKLQNTIETINGLNIKTSPKNLRIEKPRPKSEQKEKSLTYNPLLTAGTLRSTKDTSVKNIRTKSSQKKTENEIRLNEGSLSTEGSSHFRGRIEDYAIGKEIGKGAYAIVKQGLHKPTNRKVAVKIYDKVKLLDTQRKNSVKREIGILKKLDNQHIVKLMEVIDNPKQILLIMELVDGVSLLSYLKSKTNRRLEENECRQIFSQIVSAVSHCHSKSICHRDIKLENIIVDEWHNIKLIDFGFGAVTVENKLQNFFCGTPSYMPPEIVQKRDYQGLPADIWSLGILLYTLLCGMFPFRASNEKELYAKIIKGVFSYPEHMSQLSCDLVGRLLNLNPTDRPLAEHILQDLWFSSGNTFVEYGNQKTELNLKISMEDIPRTSLRSRSLVLKSKTSYHN